MRDIAELILSYYELYILILAGTAGSVIALFLGKTLKKQTGILFRSVLFLTVIMVNAILSIVLCRIFPYAGNGLTAQSAGFFAKYPLMLILGAVTVLVFPAAFSLIAGLLRGRFVSEHKYGIGTFAYLMAVLAFDPPLEIKKWGAVWYATDYSMGPGSRFFIGTVMNLFYSDRLSEKTAYFFCLITTIIIALVVAYLADHLLKRCDERVFPAVAFLWILFMVSPGSVAGIWSDGNFGRLETYCLLLSLITIMIDEKIRNRYVSYILITVCSCVSIAIYQGNVFMYYAITLMVLIWNGLKEQDNTVRFRIMGALSVLVTGICFLYFQFFSYTYFNTPDEMIQALYAKTDLSIANDAVDLEMFQPVSEAYRRLTIDFITGTEYPRVKTVLTLFILCPVLILFIAIYLKCRQERIVTFKKKVLEAPYFYFALLPFTVLPQFLLNVDWGRWMLSFNIVLFTGVFYLAWKKDEGANEALRKLSEWIRNHKIICVLVIVIVSKTGVFSGRDFVSSVNGILDWIAVRLIG